MSAAYSIGEVHRFSGNGTEYAYLVASGGIVSLDGISLRIFSRLEGMPMSRSTLISQLAAEGFSVDDIHDAISELSQVSAIHDGTPRRTSSQSLPEHFPLQTMVLNLTNQCNLSCHYCYEFGEDKVATPAGKKKFMDWETAKTSVDFLFAESQGRNSIHITFFGGETLMNFPLAETGRRLRAERSGSQKEYRSNSV